MAMVIVRDVWLCSDCTIYAANGDTSGIDDPERERQVTEAVDALGPHLSSNSCSNHDSEGDDGVCSECGEEDDGQRDFSRSCCDGCGDWRGGSRDRFAILAPARRCDCGDGSCMLCDDNGLVAVTEVQS